MDAHTAPSRLLQASSPTSDRVQLFHAPTYSLPPELIIDIGMAHDPRECIFTLGLNQRSRRRAAVSIAFVRTMDTPLTLEYREKTASVNRRTFFKLAGEWIGSWKSLSVYLSGYSRSWEAILNDLETRTAPRLEALLLHGGYVMEEGMDQVTLFGGASTPASLKKLSLSHIAIDIAALHLRGLKSLNLHTIPEITSVRLFETMVESPHIEALELNNISSLTGSI
ncbi:hypothetical protein FRB90_006248 [Tulasnella sp. 427]|nr:hypothetical protein FRB90_006248 [Tulasnella sp. 427]